MPVKKSFGVACCRVNHRNGRTEVLMIKRRTTFSFVEFVFGHYRTGDDNRLLQLFNRMTSEEKLDIASLDFGRMWWRIWLYNPEQPSGRRTREEAKVSQEKYEKYLQSRNQFQFLVEPDRGRKVRELLSRSSGTETLWEIPKGRLHSPQEKPLNCALREFEEETGVPPSEYWLLDLEPFICKLQNNKVCYTNYYFLAVMNEDSSFHSSSRLRVNYSEPQQMSEVAELQWMDLEKVRSLTGMRKLYPVLRCMFRTLRKQYRYTKSREKYLNLPGEKSVSGCDGKRGVLQLHPRTK